MKLLIKLTGEQLITFKRFVYFTKYIQTQVENYIQLHKTFPHINSGNTYKLIETKLNCA